MAIFKSVSGQGDDVVLLHGWGCTHEHMQPIINQLSKRYRVTNVDLPGRGNSEWNNNINSIHDIADLLLADLPAQAIYLGWSFGGLVSMSIASRYRERVRRFIGVTTSPKFIAEEDWNGVPQPGFQVAFAAMAATGIKTFLRTYFDNEFSSINPKPTAYHELIAINDKQDGSQAVMDILFKGINICDQTDLRKEFSTIKCPIDFIMGEKDDNVPGSAYEKIKMLNRLMNFHIIPQAQHMPFWTHPEQFNKILNDII